MSDTDPARLCPGCFADAGAANPCPRCGYDATLERGPLVLPHRTVLHGQFVVGRVLGKPGGSGITYLGWDLNLQTRAKDLDQSGDRLPNVQACPQKPPVPDDLRTVHAWHFLHRPGRVIRTFGTCLDQVRQNASARN